MADKNVLIDLHRLKYNPYNGLYTFSVGLAKALAAQPIPGIHFHYYMPESHFGMFGNNVSYVKHRSVDKFYQFGTSAYDLWHITTGGSWYHPFNKKTKVVYTIHDLNFLRENKDNTAGNTRVMKRMQANIDRAHHITAISQFALNEARQHLDFRNKPCSVVYNGADFSEEEKDVMPRFVPDGKFLFAVGLVQPRKNFHTLPALLRGNQYHIIIAGLNEFDYADKVRSAAADAGVSDRVHLIGSISSEEKDWYFKHCEAVLFPSFAEGFGLPAIEGMYYGKPVFLSTETCLPEIGGDVAYYFNDFTAEHMQQVFKKGMDDYNTRKPVEEIKRQASKFTWKKAASDYLNIYKSLL